MRARRRDRTTSATGSWIDVPSIGSRRRRQVELIDSDSAVTFPIVDTRHHPAAQLNNLFGHAPHDPKRSYSFGNITQRPGQPKRYDRRDATTISFQASCLVPWALVKQDIEWSCNTMSDLIIYGGDEWPFEQIKFDPSQSGRIT